MDRWQLQRDLTQAGIRVRIMPERDECFSAEDYSNIFGRELLHRDYFRNFNSDDLCNRLQIEFTRKGASPPNATELRQLCEHYVAVLVAEGEYQRDQGMAWNIDDPQASAIVISPENGEAYLTYSKLHADMDTLLKDAIRDYYCTFRVLPPSIVVHSSRTNEVRAALTRIELAQLAPCVQGVSGNFNPTDVWLKKNGE